MDVWPEGKYRNCLLQQHLHTGQGLTLCAILLPSPVVVIVHAFRFVCRIILTMTTTLSAAAATAAAATLYCTNTDYINANIKHQFRHAWNTNQKLLLCQCIHWRVLVHKHTLASPFGLLSLPRNKK